MANNPGTPMTTLHFEVRWGDSKGTSAFSEVGGLTAEAEVIEYRAGTDISLTTTKQPGLKKYAPITLSRGIMPQEQGIGLYEWFDSIRAGNVDRRPVMVALLNEKFDAVMTWEIKNAWPVKLEGPALKSTGTEVAIEKLEFAHEGFKINVVGV